MNHNKRADCLPEPFGAWFAARGWQLRAHQRAMLAQADARRSALLIAPTGAGKTLAGFLPVLTDLVAHRGERKGLSAIYLSPLKALAVDIERNLQQPIQAMGLPVTVENRTGDTPSSKRRRQFSHPPDILVTTPEQLALMLSYPESAALFSDCRTIIIDEIHALAPSKRGDLLALDLARLAAIAPKAIRFGLSATVKDPEHLSRYLVSGMEGPPATIITVPRSDSPAPDITILNPRTRLPWAGHSGRYAVDDMMRLIDANRLTLLFVNTRAQAELLFQALWEANDAHKRIALHHGSLDVGQRRRVEAAMAAGALDAVVATATLDLGIDWGAVDCVIQVGAPKSTSRLLQRIGRSNHRLDTPSRAVLIPTNRFEWLECRAATEAALKGEQDSETRRPGALDVLAQHVIGRVGAEPVSADALYSEIIAAEPYRQLARPTFDRVIALATDGGYALKVYEQYKKIVTTRDGLLRLRHAKILQAYRMNIGTIVEAAVLPVHRVLASKHPLDGHRVLRPGPSLGQIDEAFAASLKPGDVFTFAGEDWTLERVHDERVLVSRATAPARHVPSYLGGRLPVSETLAERVRQMVAEPEEWRKLPPQVEEWLQLQRGKSTLPPPDRLLVETFPRAKRHYLVAYPFAGRLAHQSLGMLLTQRLEHLKLRPVGFVATDYAVAIWQLKPFPANDDFYDALFAPDLLGDELEEWIGDSAMLKRAFNHCAVVSGLVERRFPGQTKRSRAVTISTDLIFDVLRRHEPDHILMEAARIEAGRELMDLPRLSQTLGRFEGQILHRALRKVSPLAVPVMLEMGREKLFGEARDEALLDDGARLLDEAVA